MAPPAALKRRFCASAHRLDAEGRQHVGADLERIGADAGAEPGVDLARPALRRLAHRLDGRAGDSRGEAAPAGMGGADGATVARGEQHRQAVGGLDDAGDAGFARHGGVGVVKRRAGRGIGGADPDDARAVHLAQEDRRGAERLGEPGAIDGDRRRIVADGHAEIHRRVAANADAAGTRRHERADAGDAPVGRERLAGADHVASGQAEGCVDANAGSAMHASNTRITVGTWSSRQSMRLALKICGTSTQSASPGVSPWQKRPVRGSPAS